MKIEHACDAPSKYATLADDVFDSVEFSIKDDEEARLFSLAGEPLSGLEVNVGGTAREASSFLFFNACKERNFFKVCGSNHCLFLAYLRVGLLRRVCCLDSCVREQDV